MKMTKNYETRDDLCNVDMQKKFKHVNIPLVPSKKYKKFKYYNVFLHSKTKIARLVSSCIGSKDGLSEL